MAHSALNHYLLLSSILGLGFVDDVDLVGFDNTSINVPENIGQVKICVTNGDDLFATIQGRIFTTNPDKTAPVTSVGNLSQTFVIKYFRNPTFCYNATVLDNNIADFGKVYYINFTLDNEMASKIENRSVLVISITNDDKVSIGFSESSITVSESDGYARVCMNRVGEAKNLGEGQEPAGALSVRLSTVQGTAKSGKDFTPLNYFPVHFGLDEMSKCVNVSIKSDNVKENMETFYITMTNGSSLVIVSDTRNNLTVNIREKVTAQFEEAYNKEIEETSEDKEIELACVIDRPSSMPIRISFDTDNFTSTAIMGSDYTIENKSLTFPPGQNRVSLKIKINRDGVAESPEILVLRMVSLDDNMVKIGKNDTAKVKINDKLDNENEAAKQEELEKERSRRRDIYILLIVAIVLIVVLFICGIVFCICFIKSKKRTDR